jgi:hypothetical protein
MPSHADRVRRNYDPDDLEPPRAETDPIESGTNDDADVTGNADINDEPDGRSD